MTERPIPVELTRLDRELSGVARRVEQRIDPGATAMVVSIAVLALIAALLLPWTGAAHGWQVLVGTERYGPLPRLFTFTALGFGVFGSTFALATRWWPLAWLCAVGCGISVINGVWAIWSRQVEVPSGASGAGLGLVLAVFAVLVLAISWARIALRR